MRYFLSIFLILLLLTTTWGQKVKHSNNIDTIVNAYLNIKNALINNDGTTAKFKANELHYLLITNPDKGLNPNQCKLIANYLGPLVVNSRFIGETISENEQRQYFAKLSQALYELLKGIKANSFTLYEQYCPVNNTYWLSATTVVRNPYYNYSNKDMTNCGKITATLVRIK